MPTTLRGIFFLTRQRPRVEGDGEAFKLTLRLFDRQSATAVEPYEVTWSGAAAAAWWQANQDIKPGQPLEVELANPRSFPVAHGAPEIRAAVTSLELARLAPSWQAAAARGTPQQGAPA